MRPYTYVNQKTKIVSCTSRVEKFTLQTLYNIWEYNTVVATIYEYLCIISWHTFRYYCLLLWARAASDLLQCPPSHSLQLSYFSIIILMNFNSRQRTIPAIITNGTLLSAQIIMLMHAAKFSYLYTIFKQSSFKISNYKWAFQAVILS